MTPSPYTSLNEVLEDVLPVLPAEWQVAARDINGEQKAAAYWLLAHMDSGRRVWPYVQQGQIKVDELLSASEKMSSGERILVLYAVDLAAPGYVASAGYDIHSPATVQRLLDHRNSETLEAAMAMANGRRHPAVGKLQRPKA